MYLRVITGEESSGNKHMFRTNDNMVTLLLWFICNSLVISSTRDLDACIMSGHLDVS